MLQEPSSLEQRVSSVAEPHLGSHAMVSAANGGGSCVVCSSGQALALDHFEETLHLRAWRGMKSEIFVA